jgi:hypothetical protein
MIFFLWLKRSASFSASSRRNAGADGCLAGIDFCNADAAIQLLLCKVAEGGFFDLQLAACFLFHTDKLLKCYPQRKGVVFTGQGVQMVCFLVQPSVAPPFSSTCCVADRLFMVVFITTSLRHIFFFILMEFLVKRSKQVRCLFLHFVKSGRLLLLYRAFAIFYYPRRCTQAGIITADGSLYGIGYHINTTPEGIEVMNGRFVKTNMGRCFLSHVFSFGVDKIRVLIYKFFARLFQIH